MRVSDLFRKDCFPDFTLLASSDNLDREITTAVVLDTPDLDAWLRGGELVLSNSYIFKENSNKVNMIIDRLAAKNIAALGIKTDRFAFTENLAQFTESFEKHKIPLIEIPFRYIWHEIITKIYYKMYLARESNIQHPLFALMSILEENMDPFDFLMSFSKILGRPIWVKAPFLELSHFFVPEDFSIIDYGEKKETVQNIYIWPHIGSLSHFTQEMIAPVNGKFAVYRSDSQPSLEMKILLRTGEFHLPINEERKIIKAMVFLRLMTLEKELLAVNRKGRREILLEKLLMDQESNTEVLKQQMKLINCEIPERSRIMVMPRKSYEKMPSGQKKIFHLYCLIADFLVSIVPCESFEREQQTVMEIARSFCCPIVFSDICTQLGDYHKAFAETREALMYLLGFQEGTSGVFPCRKILLRRIFKEFSQSQGARQLLEKIWYPLENAKNTKTISYLSFVRALVESNFNLKRCAESLHIHYNTARNYYDDVESILDLSLDESVNQLSLLTACYTYSNLGIEE